MPSRNKNSYVLRNRTVVGKNLKVKNRERHKRTFNYWTPREDRNLKLLVAAGNPWTVIAQHFPGRDAKDCAERWKNHLNKEIKKRLSFDDKIQALEMRNEMARHRWAVIARNIGCTSLCVKNWAHAWARKYGDFPVMRTTSRFESLVWVSLIARERPGL